MKLIWDGVTEAVKLVFSADPVIAAAAWRSVWISASAVLLACLLGIPLGTWLARKRTVGRRILLGCARAGISLPTVFVGLICYSVFRAEGPLGPLNLLFTPWLIMVGEFVLAFPMIVSLTHGAIRSLDPRVEETARTLGASPLHTQLTLVSEARTGLVLAAMTAFARCVTELGVAIMVGGNLAHSTRTLATATAMQTRQGEFARGIAMGGILLVISLVVAFLISWISKEE